MTYLDGYSVKARIAPALIVIVPLITVSLAWFPKLVSLPGLSALGVAAIAATMIAAHQIRRTGKTLQLELEREWNGKPTTILLRHADHTFTPEQKARYHAILQERVPGVCIPDAQRELQHPSDADRNYEMATDWLREQTRNNPVVNGENANFGFHRNLCALRPLGFISAAVAIVGSIVLLAFHGTATFDSAAVLSLAVSVVCALVMLLHATRVQVRIAAFEYASALIRAIDGTARPR